MSIASPFVLFRDDLAGGDLLFEAPSALIEAHELSDFAAALDQAEAARRNGKWLAGYFSYEAGYLFEPKLKPLLPEGRRVPLLRFGVFDGPSQTVLPRTAAAVPPTDRSSTRNRDGRSPTTNPDSGGFTGICAKATAIRSTSPSPLKPGGPAIRSRLLPR